MAPLRAVEFYSGIGGLHFALSRVDSEAKVVRAFDWDQTACRVYEANHGPGIAAKTDISTLTADNLASYNADIWLLSPACQPYTVLNPNAKGSEDPRAQSYLHLLRNVLPALAKMAKHPEYILVENVAGFEGSTTRQIQREVLKELGYHTLEVLLTPLQFEIPNSRLRYYMLARRRPFPGVPTVWSSAIPSTTNDSTSTTATADKYTDPQVDEPEKIWRHIPGRLEEVPAETVAELRSYLDGLQDFHFEEYAVPDKVLWKWGRLFDIVLPSGRRSCCFTRGYTHLVERSGSVSQMAEDLDTTETFDRFLAAQGEQEESADLMKILHPLQLRYFTPSELIRMFGFERSKEDEPFVWPAGVSKKSKYKLIGNSVNVRVVEELVRYLLS